MGLRMWPGLGVAQTKDQNLWTVLNDRVFRLFCQSKWLLPTVFGPNRRLKVGIGRGSHNAPENPLNRARIH